MPAKKKVTDRQWDVLLEYMEANPVFAKGDPVDLSPTHKIDYDYERYKQWKELTHRLNAAAGPCKNKTEKEWRKYWSRIKAKARLKVSILHEQMKNGVNGTTLQRLSNNDKRILKILGIPIRIKVKPVLQKPVKIAPVSLKPVRIKPKPDASQSLPETSVSQANTSPLLVYLYTPSSNTPTLQIQSDQDPPSLASPLQLKRKDSPEERQTETSNSFSGLTVDLTEENQASKIQPQAKKLNKPEVPPKVTTTDDQWKILLEYMEADPQFAVGLTSRSSPTERCEYHSRWAELANTLNNVECGYTRTELGWRHNWHQEKFKVRRKVAKIKKLVAEGRPKIPVITKIDKRILTILDIPIPEVPVKSSPANTTQPCAPPPDLPPLLEASSQQAAYPLQHQVKIEIEEYDPTPEPELSHTLSPLVERRTQPTKVAGTRGIKPKDRPATLPSREWVRNMKERRLAVDEKKSQALQGIQANTEIFASTLQGMHIGLVQMNQTLQRIQCALEASARAQQERLS